MVRKGGLEPPHLSVPDPKSGASANSATFAFYYMAKGVVTPAKNCTTYLNRLYNLPDFPRSTRLAADTKVFQDMADAMLPLFNDMPQVVVMVEDHEVFQREPFPLAVYMRPNIVINPAHARTSSYEDMQGTLCHELIHAWQDWKGMIGVGEHLDEHHNEGFIKKALEINKKKIDDLNVDLDNLLTTPKAIDIYNRVAGIRFVPHLRHKVRRIWKDVAGIVKVLFDQFWNLSKVVIISVSVIVITLLLYKARLIPAGVAGFVWWALAVAGLVWYAFVMLRKRTGKRSEE